MRDGEVADARAVSKQRIHSLELTDMVFAGNDLGSVALHISTIPSELLQQHSAIY